MTPFTPTIPPANKGQLRHRLQTFLAVERRCLELEGEALRLQRDIGRADQDNKHGSSLKALTAGIATTKARQMLRSLEAEQELAESSADQAWGELTDEVERIVGNRIGKDELEQVFSSEDRTISLVKQVLNIL